MLNQIFEEQDIIEVRCLHKDQIRLENGRYNPTPHMFFGTYSQLRKKADQLKKLNDNGYNIYFGSNPRDGKSTRKITHHHVLFVDLDNITVDDAEIQLASAKEKYLLPDPSLCIASGGGVHYYWRLDTPISSGLWTTSMKRLIKCFDNADKAIHDPQRIMRLVGFLNHKRGKVAKIVWEKNMRYQIAEFDDTPKIKAPSPTPTPLIKGNADGNMDRAISYFENREGAGKGQRNHEAFKIAICCISDFELTDTDTYAIMSNWNIKNTPHCHRLN